MAWNYAELSKAAKASGGPEKLVDVLIKSGKKKMVPWLFAAAVLGYLTPLGIKKVIKYFKRKKAISDAEVETAKQEIIQGIKEYDASHDSVDNKESIIDEEKELENLKEEFKDFE